MREHVVREGSLRPDDRNDRVGIDRGVEQSHQQRMTRVSASIVAQQKGDSRGE